MNLKKNGKTFTRKLVGTGSSSHKKGIYLAAVSQRLRNTGVNDLFALVGCYTALIDSYLPTFRDNFSVPSSMVNLSQKNVFLKF
jgi:fucose permease